jgi:hypothetical protein
MKNHTKKKNAPSPYTAVFFPPFTSRSPQRQDGTIGIMYKGTAVRQHILEKVTKAEAAEARRNLLSVFQLERGE